MLYRSCVLTLLATGCYVDITAGVARSYGGVRGYGWELGIAGGLSFGGTEQIPVRVGVGVDANLSRRDAQDGALETKSLGLQARVEAGTTVKGALIYSRSVADSLGFKPDTDPKTYSGNSTVHRVYLGIQREYFADPVQVAYGVGPTYTYMPNDFVGDTAAVGIQFRASHYFFPTFKARESGSMMDTYSGPKPIEQGPAAPGPLRCRDTTTGREYPC